MIGLVELVVAVSRVALFVRVVRTKTVTMMCLSLFVPSGQEGQRDLSMCLLLVVESVHMLVVTSFVG